MGEHDNNQSAQLSDQRRIGDFEILREIGRGGMGVVYEALQTSLGRKVALKILSTGLGLTPQAVQRFQREAESAARLHHTNIVPIYATGAEKGVHFYAMELIEGPSLDHVIRRMRGEGEPSDETPVPADGSELTVAYDPTAGDSHSGSAVWKSSSLSSGSQYFDTVARLVAEVADALEYAHRHNVVHRDIKPANLLVSPEGRLSLNDFGLARVLEQPGMTATGEILGTPAYMSPEQLTAGRTPLDHRTDIYSLGATLYELLTLQRPFVGERRDQVLSQILHKDPRPPRSVNKKIPVDLETICLKAMEKDPDRRYQSAGAMAEDLRRYVNRFAISARRVGPIGKTMKWARRHPGMTTGMACAVVGIILAAFFANRANKAEQRRSAEKEQSQKQLATLQREHALENALLAATSGDLEKADDAIREAEAKGASIADIRVLRGQVAYFRGDFEQALEDLKQAVELNPQSIVARGMLAQTYLHVGDWEQYEQSIMALETVEPTTPEDFLFKGYAEFNHGGKGGLDTLNEAVKRSRSPFARVVRAEVRAGIAEDLADMEEAEGAISDIQVAREQLPDNPHVFATSVTVKLIKANLHRQRNELEAEQTMLDGAERDAQALQPFETLPSASAARWHFFQRVGRDESAFEVARVAADHSTAPAILFRRAMSLYQRNEIATAIDVLKKRKSGEIANDVMLTCLLAELHPHDLGKAHEVYARLTEQHYTVYTAYVPQRYLRFLGENEKAIAASRDVRKKYGPLLVGNPWKPLFDYYCDDISEDELLQQVDPSQWIQFYRHYSVALANLAVGNRSRAKEQFRLAERCRLEFGEEWNLCRLFLQRFEHDSSWPPWIPVKQ